MDNHDPVNHPEHYTSHPSGVECIDITRHMTFNIGNVIKYCWRSGLKDGNPSVQDLRKAAWYLNDEIRRLEGKPEHVLDMAPGEGIGSILRGTQGCSYQYPYPTKDPAILLFRQQMMEQLMKMGSQPRSPRHSDLNDLTVWDSSLLWFSGDTVRWKGRTYWMMADSPTPTQSPDIDRCWEAEPAYCFINIAHDDPQYHNDVKSGIDDVAAKINEAVNPDYQTPLTGFQKELEGLINDYSMESGSDTPDFLLAELLCDVLEVWNKAVVAREAWYGRVTEPVSPENWPTQNDAIPGESLDALEAEMKKFAAPIEMIDGKPYYVGNDVREVEEITGEWDQSRLWARGQIIRWRGYLYRYDTPLTVSHLSWSIRPDGLSHWTRLPE